MKVLFAAAEFSPLARVGGLAAAAAGYVAELRRHDVDVEVVMPDYFDTPLDGEIRRSLPMPPWAGEAWARRGSPAGPGGERTGPITLVTVEGIRRPHPYLQVDGTGWPDNDRRFFAFSAAVAALVEAEQPDVLHLNDWHTATTLAHLATPPPTVLTIHTLGYQGQTDLGWLDVFPHRHESFEFWHGCNPLVGGIRGADLVIAVSPHYAAEITTDEHGFGLAGILRDKGDRVVGILNGIDADEWNPSTDPHLSTHYDIATVSAKEQLRNDLLADAGLAPTRGPVFAMVTRLADQKGVDLVVPSIPYLAGVDARLIVLGSGDAALSAALRIAADDHPNEFAFREGYDDAFAHRIFGGVDAFLMPSRFEPCGLAQMQAMRYGTLPVVTDVGGLHDTVVDVDADPKAGTGIVIGAPSAVGVIDGIHRAARALAQPRRRLAMQRRGMTTDWSWRGPVEAHLDWYRTLLG